MCRQSESVSAAPIIYSFCLIRDDVPPLDYRSFYLAGALALCPVFKISKILRPLAAARCLVWGVLPNMKWKEGRRHTDRMAAGRGRQWKVEKLLLWLREKSIAGTLGSQERNSAQYTWCCLTCELDRTRVCKTSATHLFPHYWIQNQTILRGSRDSHYYFFLQLPSSVDIQRFRHDVQYHWAASSEPDCKKYRLCRCLDHLPGTMWAVKSRMKPLWATTEDL